MNEIAETDVFDYSLVDSETQNFLEEKSLIILGIQSRSAYDIGKQLLEAQQKLSSFRTGIFENWYLSLGFKKTKAYEYINHYEFIRSQGEQYKIDKFESLPKKLQADVSKKTADERVNEAVFNGDVKSHEEYKQLERQLKQKDERIITLENAEPRVIEKRVEVPPSDYYSLKQANESLQREVENNVTKLSGVKSLLDLEQQKYKLLESESREAKELKSNIDTLLDTKESLSNQIKLLTEFNEKTGKLKQVFDSELASLRFRPYVNELSSTEATNRLWELVDSISFWVDEMNKMRPNDNMKIIEGELL
ncbi:MAG: hypothetical protein UEM45_01855 [Enterococcus faecalis]|nr:hypothetical protein [Enterococcus faecalis]